MAGATPVAGMLGLTFEVAGVPQVARVLGVMMRSVRNLQPAWGEIADDFVKREKRLFQQQGSVQGWDRWAALHPDYEKWKQTHGFSTRILVRTGAVERSLTTRHDRHAVFNAGPLRMEIGTSIPYAGYHQTGTRKMPKREPIRITDTQRRHWVHLIQQFLIESGQFERVGGERPAPRTAARPMP